LELVFKSDDELSTLLKGKGRIQEVDKIINIRNSLGEPPDEEDKDKPLEGIIAAIGKGKMLDNGVIVKPDLKVGDRVFFGKYSGFEMNIDGEEYIMMRDSDVLCKIK
jgi:co-chaperonin GroES (HSP10)